jgi:hypothetical protein
MRNIYVLVVMTAMAFVAAASAGGDNKPKPPSKSCPPNYTWSSTKGACMPPHCPKGQEWNNKLGKCTKEE